MKHDVQKTMLPFCSRNICIGTCWFVNSKQHKYWYTMLSLPHTFSLVLSKLQKRKVQLCALFGGMLVSNLCFLKSLLFRLFLLTCPTHTVSLWAGTRAHFSLSICVFKRSASCFITVKIDGRKIGGGFWRESAYMVLALLGVLHSSKPFTQAHYKNKLNKTLQPDREKKLSWIKTIKNIL